MEDLLQLTSEGLFCPAGGFHIDPWGEVDRAVLTHAHSDHARPGSRQYLCAEEGVGLTRERVGGSVQGLPYGQTLRVGEVDLALHPAGHVLGSAQVRVEHHGYRWVVSGDYKLTPDPTCRAFEPVKCEVFITEATFALPIYRWRPAEGVALEINDWWRANREAGRTSVLYAYTLGKSQRLLAGLDPGIGPIFVHGAILRYIEAYRAAGVKLPPVAHAVAAEVKAQQGRAMVIAPPSAAGSPWVRKLGPVAQGQASGWMRVRGRRRWQSLDRGFVLSDHADWEGLLTAIRETGAGRIGITHGYTHPLERYLKEQGRETFVLPTYFEGEADEPEPAGEV